MMHDGAPVMRDAQWARMAEAEGGMTTERPAWRETRQAGLALRACVAKAEGSATIGLRESDAATLASMSRGQPATT